MDEWMDTGNYTEDRERLEVGRHFSIVEKVPWRTNGLLLAASWGERGSQGEGQVFLEEREWEEART